MVGAKERRCHMPTESIHFKSVPGAEERHDQGRGQDGCGVDLDVSSYDLWDWFCAYLPLPDLDLGDMIVDLLLAVHELVEINEVLKKGVTTAKDAIINNTEKVEDAHLKVTMIELMVARAIGAKEHIQGLLLDIERWSTKKALSETRRGYRDLLREAKVYLYQLSHRAK
jgi:hypothetical protein